jgi:spoIIIJ-associated protein
MEWVETTGRSIEAAREAALDQLGVGADEAEFDILEEPRPGLFGRMRGEARLRARVRPAQARPKQERRRRGREKSGDATTTDPSSTGSSPESDSDTAQTPESSDAEGQRDEPARPPRARRGSTRTSKPKSDNNQEQPMNSDDRPESTVTPQEVGEAAVAFMDGLTTAFGVEGSADLAVDGLELDVNVNGAELGLLVGPGGRTLNAIQDLARVAAQRRLGDHETRLRIDVAGYRERREAALAKFARDVAGQVRESGTARSLEPMTSADRKVVHDVLNDEDGVESRSEGEDPNRRIIVEPI